VETQVYYPNYVPKNEQRFGMMLKAFGNAESHQMLKDMSILYILDLSFPREDILVALGRVERARGWK